jgi:hypothetical protein
LSLTSLMLIGCGASGTKGIDPKAIPEVPADIVACFDKLTPKPRAGTLTAGQVFTLVGTLRTSEVRLAGCGKRLVAWVNGLRGDG